MSFHYKSEPYRLKHGFSVVFELDARTGKLDAQWEPTIPRGIVFDSILPTYRAMRDHFISTLDIPAAVVEI